MSGAPDVPCVACLAGNGIGPEVTAAASRALAAGLAAARVPRRRGASAVRRRGRHAARGIRCRRDAARHALGRRGPRRRRHHAGARGREGGARPRRVGHPQRWTTGSVRRPSFAPLAESAQDWTIERAFAAARAQQGTARLRRRQRHVERAASSVMPRPRRRRGASTSTLATALHALAGESPGLRRLAVETGARGRARPGAAARAAAAARGDRPALGQRARAVRPDARRGARHRRAGRRQPERDAARGGAAARRRARPPRRGRGARGEPRGGARRPRADAGPDMAGARWGPRRGSSSTSCSGCCRARAGTPSSRWECTTMRDATAPTRSSARSRPRAST